MRVTAAVGLALVVSTAVPGAVHAQLTTEVRGGSSIPAGDIDEITDAGAFLGVGIGWRYNSRITFRVDGDFELLNEQAVPPVVMPRTYLWHFQGGVELDVTSAEASEWLVRARGGAGATIYDTRELFVGGDDFLDTYFSVSGGLSVGRMVTDNLEFGGFGKISVVFTDKDRTRELSDRNPAVLNAFSKASTFPLGFYLRWQGLTPLM